MADYLVVSEKFFEQLHFMDEIARQVQNSGMAVVVDKNLEIGITDYDQYTTEVVHYHTEAVEYQYMLSGWTKYMDVETGVEYEFKKGDFYYIEKNWKI